MNRYTVLVRQLLMDETGQDLVEYALVAGLIGIAGIVSFGNFGSKLTSAFNTVGNSLTNAL